jgi:aspartate kinase
MALIVQKYGGTSVADIERFRNVAQRVLKTKELGNDVVVVVSAMAGETDRLLTLAQGAASEPDERELDVLLATGEQASSSLLAIVLNAMGHSTKSFLGHQIKIATDSVHGKARITSIDAEKIFSELREGRIVVVAGFQGEDDQGNITTLGRGGSDTSAVAIAAALKADLCEIYTDVDGVFTTNPEICEHAHKIERISYDEMLEMASLGAKVLQTRSVEFAKKYGVPIHVRSSFQEGEGTIVCEEEADMEQVVVSGVTYDVNQARIEIARVPDRPGIAAQFFDAISKENILVDMIIQTTSLEEGLANMAFTISKADFPQALTITRSLAKKLGATEVIAEDEVAKVSMIGVGMRGHSGVASKMFDVLSKEGINIKMISTSEIKISCIIDAKYTELAVRSLHKAFDLDKGTT